MDGFVAFAIGFSLLFWIWYQQYVFFRRYGLEDGWTITLNGALLFVVLFFVYPLKFLFVNLVKMIAGRDTRVLLSDGALHAPIGPGDAGTLMAIYSTGYVAIFAIFYLLYRRAWRARAELGLSQVEEIGTRISLREQLINVGVGGASLLMAMAGGDRWGAPAGWIYLLVGPLYALNGFLGGREMRRAAIAAGATPSRPPGRPPG
jgi:hypothetical protein